MSGDNIYVKKRLPDSVRYISRRFYHDTLAMTAFYAFILLLLICFFGRLLAPYGPEQLFPGYQLLPPSWSHYGDVDFFLGTDDLGRDQLSRLLSAAAPTVGSAIIVTLLASVCALFIAVVTTLTGGLSATIVRHILDTLLSVPFLLIAIVIVAFTGPGLGQTLLAVWLSLLPRLVRAIAAAIQDERDKTYVIASRLEGAGNLHILWYCILPNILTLLVSECTRALSLAMLDIAAMGFLNLGAQRPSIEWGSMMNDALELIYVAPWTVMLPGAAIMFSVLIVNLLGDGLCRAIDTGGD